jgi:hypothetical protein
MLVLLLLGCVFPLGMQLGEAYHSLLDLPADLTPRSDRSLDGQLQMLHGVISRAFRQHGFCASDDDQIDAAGYAGCFVEGGREDSGVSECNGGVCGGDEDMDDAEE